MVLSSAGSNNQAKWETVVRAIKPHTKHTLTFWYRLPLKGIMEVRLFGQGLPITKMFRYNPRHWCRYSAIVDSGSYQGDCRLVFMAKEGKGPYNFWIDQIELYEGESPIGKNCARLEYQYYDRAYVSPDILSPLPFAFEWTFADGQRPAEIQYIVELPAEVEYVSCALGRMCKAPPDGWDITWTRPDHTSKVEVQEVSIGNRPYKRIIAHVPCLPGDQRQLSDYVVPVGVRDYWKDTLGRYSGKISMTLYVHSKAEKGSFPFYYYAQWDKGRQVPKELTLQVTRIPPVEPSQSLVLISEVPMQAGDKNPQLGEDLRHIGLNGMGHLDLREGDKALKAKIGSLRRMGLKYFSLWVNIPAFSSADKEAWAMDRTGRRSKPGEWCLSYRGKDWVRKMEEYKRKLESGINFFAFDDALPSSCFCEQCKKAFGEFFKKISDLPFIDPSIFMQDGWAGNPEYKILWKDFSLWHYGKTAQVMKETLFKHAGSIGLKIPVYFGISSWLPFTHPFAAGSLTAFDFDIRQTYLNWAESSFGGSPKLVGDYLFHSQEALGVYARPLAPTLSPGLTYMHPACALDPYAQMKVQILEAMMAPNFTGYIMYAGSDIDLGDMKYMAEANALMKRFENIIINGQVKKPVKINEWSGVRIKKLGAQGLVLVSDYSTYEPTEKWVRFSSPDLNGETLVDAETGERLKAFGGRYRVKIGAERARLFSLGHE
ncbi:MAG: hypothetical protein V2B13_06970 [Pseudomonadota bacterium]